MGWLVVDARRVAQGICHGPTDGETGRLEREGTCGWVGKKDDNPSSSQGWLLGHIWWLAVFGDAGDGNGNNDDDDDDAPRPHSTTYIHYLLPGESTAVQADNGYKAGYIVQ